MATTTLNIARAMEEARDMVREAHVEGKLEHLTMRIVRQEVEEFLELEKGALEQREYKKQINAVIQATIDELTGGDPGEDETHQKSADKKPKPKPNAKKDAGEEKSNAQAGRKRKSAGGETEVKKRRKKLEDAEKSGEKPVSTKTEKGSAKRKGVTSKEVVDDDDEDESMPTPGPSKSDLVSAYPPVTSPSTIKKIVIESDFENGDTAEPDLPPKKGKESKDKNTFKNKSKAKKDLSSTASKRSEAPESSGSPGGKGIKPTIPVVKSKRPKDSVEEPKNPDFMPLAASSSKVPTSKDGAKSDSELSVLIDDDPPAKKTVRGKKSKGDAKEKKPRRKKETPELSPDEEQIKRLKSLVVACGVRKVWSKELKDCDTPSRQIAHLRSLLTGLGMKGRFSLEQAKVIKERRELAQEIEDVRTFAQQHAGEGRPQRPSSGTAKTTTRNESDKDEGGDREDEEEGAPSRRSKNAHLSIMGFLADQTDSD